ncbi:MAG: hypothetical protein ACE5JG_09855, partial [Planctomycetota bacterium]
VPAHMAYNVTVLDAMGRFAFEPTRMLIEGLRRIDEDRRHGAGADVEELSPLEILSALEQE